MVSQERVVKTNVHKCASEIIYCPRPRAINEVSELLDDLLKDSQPSSVASSSQSLHGKIDKLIEQINPYIYGGTPMCAALRSAQSVFEKSDENLKVLCIISNGQSTDGDPREIAEELRSLGVIIATCFLTSDRIEKPRCLMYYPRPSWRRNDGRRTLLEMSSTMKNTHTPISYLVDANWELASSGESRLFVQANSLDIVNEFCKIIVSQGTEHCDAFVDLIQKVNLGTHINAKIKTFEPTDQGVDETCYARAVAAVFHLAMHRIVGREGGIPDFYTIYDRIISSYGVNYTRTEMVLEEFCPEYRLHFQEVDETGARKAINKRRPVVTIFSLYEPQWNMFDAFYDNTPEGILRRADITGQF